jgi:predicted DNA-binding transcriptional regulator
MSKDQLMGLVTLLGSILGIIVYFYLVLLSPWPMLTIQISAFIAVAAVLLIIAWIGYMLATTPPPTPIEDLDIEDIPTSEPETETQNKEQE